MNRKWKIAFYSWFAFIPPIVICIDMFFATIQPTSTALGDQERLFTYFDLSFINQIVFLSVWTAVLISIFGFCNLINLFTNKMPHWMVGKNNHTFVTSMGMVVFLTYGFTFIAAPDQIQGFDAWYKILKSTLEHFVTPVVLLIFYFIYRGEIVSPAQYAKKTGWWTIIFPAVYILFIVIRAAMLYTYGPDSDYLNQNGQDWKDNVVHLFPYEGFDPWEDPVYIWLPACLAIILAPYGLGNLFNYLSNLSTKSLNKHARK